MYRHLLVPTDGSPLAANAVEQAVLFAASIGARITFFHARADYAATSDGAVERAISPGTFAQHAAGPAAGVLAKAEEQALRAGVEFDSIVRTSDRPYEAIIDAAEAAKCDLIFMASHGRRGIRGLMLGSQTQKVLAHARIPVLVAAIESNLPPTEMSIAMGILRDEHLSLAAVIHALEHLVRQARAGIAVDFQVLHGLVEYIRRFPGSLHHPKEERYLFDRLQQRTTEGSDIIAELKSQHAREKELVARLAAALSAWQAGGDAAAFGAAADRLAEAIWEHMRIEEKIVLPIAVRYLAPEDWTAMAKAFGENGDPMFGREQDEDFKDLFAQVLTLIRQE
jgi:nucleotide-binding universal stress UspA family protein/hemerythrin-like domain-containing protein